MTTDSDLPARPVVFLPGELEPAPLPRGRHQLIGRLALFALAGVTALGALSAVASWSVTGAVGSRDPPRSLWNLPPAVTKQAINLSDNHPEPVTIPDTASSDLPVGPPQGSDVPGKSSGTPKTGDASGDNEGVGPGTDGGRGGADSSGSGGDGSGDARSDDSGTSAFDGAGDTSGFRRPQPHP